MDKKALVEKPVEESKLSVEINFNKEKYERRIKALDQYLDNDISDESKRKIKEEISLYQVALNIGVPVSGLVWMGGNPYITTTGLLYKTHEIASQHGGLKRISAKPLKHNDGSFMLSTEAGQPAFFRGIVEFLDGSIFEDIGEASISNIKMSTIRPFMNSMAARRATNRAMRLATGVGLVSVEEMEDGEVREENVEKRLLTKKEMEAIRDIFAKIENAGTKEKLEEAKKEFEAMKKDLNELQIWTIQKVIKKRNETL